MPCYIKQSIFCGCPCKNNRNKPVTKVVGESLFTGTIQGFPGGSVAKNLLAMQETQVWSLDQEDPGRGQWQPTPVFLPGEFLRQRSLAGYSPCGCKELDTTEWVTHIVKVRSSDQREAFSPVLQEGRSVSVTQAEMWRKTLVPLH